MCRSTYYDRPKRKALREQKQAPVLSTMRLIHESRFKKRYGSRRMRSELRKHGYDFGRHKVSKLMATHGIVASKTKLFIRTTDSNHTLAREDNHLARDFTIGEQHRAWTGDITYLYTLTGVIYLAALIDIGTRKLVGYAMAHSMEKQLCIDALHMAHIHEGAAPLLLHSDLGSQYLSAEYKSFAKKEGTVLSHSRKGNCWDNACMESFFASFKAECGDTFADLADAQQCFFDYFHFYNLERPHSSLGYLTPCEFSKSLDQKGTATLH